MHHNDSFTSDHMITKTFLEYWCITSYSHGIAQTYHSMDFDNFSSAVDIVTGAFPMPSCRSSVHHSSVVSNLSFKSNRHPSFHPMFRIFVLNVHNTIALIKPAELEFLFLAFIYFYGFLIIKNSSKLGFSKVFGHLLKKLLMQPDHVTYVTGILWVRPMCVCVCENWSMWAKFSSPFWPWIVPKIRQKASFSSISQKVSTGFKRNLFFYVH